MASIPPARTLQCLFYNDDDCVNFLLEKGILYNDVCCPSGHKRVRLENHRWRCSLKNCRRSRTIFKDTIFEDAKIGPGRIIEAAYHWLNDSSHKQIMSITGLEKPTITSLLAQFREIIASNIKECSDKIGGPGIVVEIDETAFGRRKYNVGHVVKETWVFGGVERTKERRIFARVVPNRSRKTLFAIIKECVADGSIIYSDMWAAYASIERDLNMEHGSVNHSTNFKDPETEVHTNTIEGNWNGFKIKILPRNRSQDRMQDHLYERIWKRQNNDTLWDSFIRCLSEFAVTKA